MFPLDAALSGHLVATVIEVLLVDAGYQVIPLGIERVVRELRNADAERFRQIAPPRLRSMPDLFVIDPDGGQGWLVEVKFRRYLHSKLVEDIGAVQTHWAPLLLVLAVAEPPDEWTGLVRHLRVFRIEPEARLTHAFFAGHGERIQDVFGRLTPKWPEATIQQAQDVILRIATED
ncbi:MAG: hypothetical protein A3E31_06455 [Candidatus Rokubacteria bacterium RIFCSPHIGHO2_12_FULL_73_22]|nr:MAG: hypothetical protein A3E31_06455 [Candidatus Rokubacteria bacterium RIFCSPHIGHO2_12_FULL_73_22]